MPSAQITYQEFIDGVFGEPHWGLLIEWFDQNGYNVFWLEEETLGL